MNIYLQTATEAARQGGKIFKSYFGKPKGIRQKDGNPRNLVTAADKEIERLIKKIISKNFPEHQIIGEEYGDIKTPQKDMVWIIDPIDGTTNFIQGIPICCISIGLWDKKGPLVGLVYNPLSDELYTAVRGKGTYLNGRKISVSKVKNLSGALGGIGWTSEDNKARELFTMLLPVTRKSRSLGSTALQLCYVGIGVFDYYIISGMSIWDIAAAMLIVTEGGGKVTDWQGKTLGNDTGKITASNGYIHKELVSQTKTL